MRALLALFVRSMREDARARLPPILRATLVVVILLILWSNERDFTRRPAPGREFLGMVLFANVGLIAIATLGIFSSAITEEKEDQTLTLLRMTKLNPLAILLGKSTTRLIGALLLLVVQIPFTLLAVTLGGVSMAQVLNAYAVLGATTFFACNLALLCSVICPTAIRAGIWTGVWCCILFFILPMICIVSGLRRLNFAALVPSTAWEHFSTWTVESNPAYTLAVLIFEPSKVAPVERHILVNLTAGLVCFLISWLVFDRFCSTAQEVVASRRKKKGWRIFARSRPSCRRPLAWKDYHFLIGGRRGMWLRVGIGALIFLAAYSFVRWVRMYTPENRYLWRTAGSLTILYTLVAFALDASLTASRIFGEERRLLTLGSLVTLPRTTGSLIRQKILGCLPALLPWLAIFVFGFWLRSHYTYGWRGFFRYWFQRIQEERAILFYLSSQTLLLPILIANLSLRIRRGAMPAGIAIVITLNVLTAVAMDSSMGFSEREKLATSGAISVFIAVILAVGVYRRIPVAAAAE